MQKTREDLKKEKSISIANIKEKYSKVWKKMDFIREMAKKLDLDESSIRNHHVSTNWGIPKKYHEAYHTSLDKVLKEQSER